MYPRLSTVFCIADSGARVHVTCDPTGKYDHVPAARGDGMIVGDSMCLHVECFRKDVIIFLINDCSFILRDVAHISRTT